MESSASNKTTIKYISLKRKRLDTTEDVLTEDEDSANEEYIPFMKKRKTAPNPSSDVKSSKPMVHDLTTQHLAPVYSRRAHKQHLFTMVAQGITASHQIRLLDGEDRKEMFEEFKTTKEKVKQLESRLAQVIKNMKKMSKRMKKMEQIYTETDVQVTTTTDVQIANTTDEKKGACVKRNLKPRFEEIPLLSKARFRVFYNVDMTLYERYRLAALRYMAEDPGFSVNHYILGCYKFDKVKLGVLSKIMPYMRREIHIHANPYANMARNCVIHALFHMYKQKANDRSPICTKCFPKENDILGIPSEYIFKGPYMKGRKTGRTGPVKPFGLYEFICDNKQYCVLAHPVFVDERPVSKQRTCWYITASILPPEIREAWEKTGFQSMTHPDNADDLVDNMFHIYYSKRARHLVREELPLVSN